MFSVENDTSSLMISAFLLLILAGSYTSGLTSNTHSENTEPFNYSIEVQWDWRNHFLTFPNSKVNDGTLSIREGFSETSWGSIPMRVEKIESIVVWTDIEHPKNSSANLSLKNLKEPNENQTIEEVDGKHLNSYRLEDGKNEYENLEVGEDLLMVSLELKRKSKETASPEIKSFYIKGLRPENKFFLAGKSS